MRTNVQDKANLLVAILHMSAEDLFPLDSPSGIRVRRMRSALQRCYTGSLVGVSGVCLAIQQATDEADARRYALPC